MPCWQSPTSPISRRWSTWVTAACWRWVRVRASNRERGFRIGAEGVQEIDLSPLYARLRQDLPNLNIEGAARVGFELVLAHRGVGKSDASCLVRLDASRLLTRRPSSWTAEGLIEIRPVSLGDIDGVALSVHGSGDGRRLARCITLLPPRHRRSYLDGACRGSVIGRLTKGSALPTARLRPDVKAEGLAFLGRSVRENTWAVVTDADDPGLCAKFYELRLPR
jgi:hypothetical protein